MFWGLKRNYFRVPLWDQWLWSLVLDHGLLCLLGGLISGWKMITLLWRHNGRDGVSNYQLHDCLLNGLIRRRSKKTSKLRVTGLCAGIHRGQEIWDYGRDRETFLALDPLMLDLIKFEKKCNALIPDGVKVFAFNCNSLFLITLLKFHYYFTLLIAEKANVTIFIMTHCQILSFDIYVAWF